MKYCILMLLPLLMAFHPKETVLKDGKYANGYPGDLVYAVEISNDHTRIKFLMKENESDPAQAKFVTTGEIATRKGKYFIRRFDGNRLARTDIKLEMKIKDSTVIFKSRDLMATFFQSYTIYSDKIKFTLQSK